MREILFRCKRLDNNEFIYFNNTGSLIEDVKFGAGTFGKGVNIKTLNLTQQRVDLTNIDEYTGLTDKNGTKIFEGDIVRVHDKFIDIVKYELGCFIMSKQMINYEFTYQDFNNIEIIGNIYDNPELLEV